MFLDIKNYFNNDLYKIVFFKYMVYLNSKYEWMCKFLRGINFNAYLYTNIL